MEHSISPSFHGNQSPPLLIQPLLIPHQQIDISRTPVFVFLIFGMDQCGMEKDY